MSEVCFFDSSIHGMVAKTVKERAKEGKCLCCESKAVKRGICVKCYNAWAYVASKMSKRDKAAFEAKCIARGKLLSRYDSTFRKVKNIFEKLA